MKKVLLIVSLFFLFYSCDKKEEIQNVRNKVVKLKTVNSFKTKEDLQRLVYSNKPTTQYRIQNSSSYNTPEIQEKRKLLDELIPNQNFRNIVNDDGEVIVGDTIYKVSKYGTFYTSVPNRKKIYELDEFEISDAPHINTKLKKFNDVFLYETFKEYDEDNNKQDDNTDLLSNEGKGETQKAKVDFSKFPVKSISRHTILGKLRDKLFGEDKWQHCRINGDNRLSAKLYNYNYVIVRSTGFKTCVERDAWYGWPNNEDWSDGIYYGWSDLLLKMKLDIPKFKIPQPFVEHKDYYEYRNVSFSNFPFAVGDGYIQAVPFIMKKKVSYANVQKMIYDFLGGKLVSTINSAKKSANAIIIDSPKNNTRYIYIRNFNSYTSSYKKKCVFDKQVKFEIYIGTGSSFTGYLMKSVRKSLEIEDVDIVHGSAYAYVLFDNETKCKGMIVKKFLDK